ncbi:MAG: sodium/glutamate symporter [Crocosphaera sp.]|nr:sodium/glutamate symporter [Crocosphaera sp.]
MKFSARDTLVIAILVLYLGKFLNRKIVFLRKYNIPEPVSGGVLASIFFSIIYFMIGTPLEFALNMRDTFLLIFFTTIGLSAKFSALVKGGKSLIIVSILASFFLIIQNTIGILAMTILGLPLALGIISGSIPLSGGHGTVIAWSPIFAQDYGVTNAAEVGIATATFGLILGGLVGGPIANFLITRHQLTSKSDENLVVGFPYDDQPTAKIDYNTMLNVILVITICIGIGVQANIFLQFLGLNLPEFVTCLFAGILLTNTIPFVFKSLPWPADTPSMELVSDLSLGMFLSISLMSLQLWTLSNLAGSILLVLIFQLVAVIAYSMLILFNLAGKDFDAATMAAGFAGLSLGATPTAIANMTAVTELFGPSPKAFIVIPLVGAFFIDIANVIVIQQFLNFVQ